MDNSIVQKIRDELSRSDNIAIVTGRNPSLDEMAAALSLYLLLRDSNKKVTIACPTQPIVELSSLVGIDKVVGSLSGGQEGDLVVSFPYVEGEIEKVSYTLENGFLNIIVKSAQQGLTFDEKDVRYTKGGGGGSFNLLIVLGTPNLSDLGDLIDPEKLRDAKIINIDNKQDNQGYGDIVAVSPAFSSVSEQIADLILTLGIRIDRDVAQNLLSGITYATKNFQMDSTSPLAFEIASLLMRNGARREMPSGQPRQQQAQAPRYAREPQPEARPAPRPQRFPTNEPRQNNQPGNQPSQDEQQGAPNDWLSPKVYKGSSNF